MRSVQFMQLCAILVLFCLFFTNCRGGTLNQYQEPLLKFNTHQFAPYTYEKNGVADGPVAHIIQQACKRAAIPCRLSLLDWMTAQQQVKDGSADGLFVIGWSAARANWYHYSVPLIESEYGFFSLAGRHAQYTDIFELKGLTIAVQGPSNMSKYLSRIKLQLDGDLNVRVFDTLPECFEQLSKDQKIDFVYADKSAGKSYFFNHQEQAIRYVGRHQRLQYFIGVSKQVDRALFDTFNKALAQLRREGEIQRIFDAYGLFSPSKFACKSAARATSSALSPHDITAMKRRLEGIVYNSTWFDELSCAYDRRFRPHGRGVITDNAIDVMWALSPQPEKMTWRQTKARIDDLNKHNYGGYNDWRVPTVEELYSVLLFGDYEQNYFIDHLTKGHKLPFWSSDQLKRARHRWAIDFVDGKIAPTDENEWLGVIAVRTIKR